MIWLSRAKAAKRRLLRTAAARRGRRIALIASMLLAASAAAKAADMPEDDTFLRGSYTEDGPPGYVRWDGVSFGAHVGYSNMTTNFANMTTTPQSTTNSTSYGGFLGYNWQWDSLVLGAEATYNRPASMNTSASIGGTTSSVKLNDYATFRGRAGYAFSQFQFYGFLGVAAGRINYSSVTAGVLTQGRDNAYSVGAAAGLGFDVSILPNLFLRAEYEYVAFSPVGNMRSTMSTARAGVGMRF